MHLGGGGGGGKRSLGTIAAAIVDDLSDALVRDLAVL